MTTSRRAFMAAAVAATIVLAGCANDNNSGSATTPSSSIVTKIDKPVEITFWHAMTGAQGDTLKKLTDDFMAANPNIKVTLQNQSSYGDLQKKITSTLQSPKNLPTITQAYPDWLAQPVKDGMIVDLTPYINAKDDSVKLADWESDYLSGLRQGVTFDGKILGMPFNKSTEVLWYNKTMFNELGLKPPSTYQEFVDASKKIKEAKGIPGAGFDSLSNFFITYIKNNGNKSFNKDLDVTGPEATAAIDFYATGVKEGYLRIAGTDKFMSGPFSNQQVGMYIGSNAGESFVKKGAEGKFEYGAAAYPAKMAVQQGTDIYMFDSASPEQRTAAFSYEKFLTNKDSQITWAINTGDIPVRQSAIADPKYTGSGSAIAPILKDATANLFLGGNLDSTKAFNDTGAALEKYLAKPEQSSADMLKAFKSVYDSDWS